MIGGAIIRLIGHELSDRLSSEVDAPRGVTDDKTAYLTKYVSCNRIARVRTV